MAELAKRRMRGKIPPLEQALTGLVRDHHRRLLALQLAPIDVLDAQIDALSAEMTRRLAALSGGEPSVMAPEPTVAVARPATPESTGAPLTFAQAVTLLDTIAGDEVKGDEVYIVAGLTGKPEEVVRKGGKGGPKDSTSILKFFQFDRTGRCRMTSSARSFKVGSENDHVAGNTFRVVVGCNHSRQIIYRRAGLRGIPLHGRRPAPRYAWLRTARGGLSHRAGGTAHAVGTA